MCTIPWDTTKVRLQLQKKAVVGDAMTLPKYKGMLGTVAPIAREEGLTSLWKDIVHGLHRQCLFGGLRIPLYEPISFISFSCWNKLLMCLCACEGIGYVFNLFWNKL
ncbi:Mitochondrial uncoupling protein 1 [Camellia lanceoleosa]|uniref:Mitochondrial uncoupling protein 1 n=1 Tax=Camellia lanceoleosa TaxID=1840588 RepID=A0ACC0H8A4_9ERIC|nr:Mitochondrial uncoupling protein 1 [Camellia lanceoleosa]